MRTSITAFGGWNVGDIRDPDFARTRWRESLFQQILGYRKVVLGVPRRQEFASLLAAQFELPTQPPDAIASDIAPLRGQFVLDAARPIDLAALPVRGGDQHFQSAVFLCSCPWFGVQRQS